MDSREYVFIYPLRTNTDIPADFPQEFQSFTFETGIFLPQDDSNWFTRLPRYPARLLLLERRSLYIVPHPSSEQSLVELKLNDLVQVETGCILLHGWMKFTTRGGVQEIVYNTRGSRPLEMFLGLLKRRWLDNVPPLSNVRADVFGDELDIKFKNSVRLELDQGERVVAQYFQAPVRIHNRFLFFRRVNWRAGNVLLLTSMNRLVWITDQFKGRRELYASMSLSIPCSLLQNCRVEDAEGQQSVVMSFCLGFSWRIPVHGPLQECSSWLSYVN
jgi:hypothetical protein